MPKDYLKYIIRIDTEIINIFKKYGNESLQGLEKEKRENIYI